MLALCGGTVATSLDPVELTGSDITIEADRVVAVGRARPGAVRRDCSGCLVLPGNVCAHTHLYSALSRGMPYSLAPPASFVEILQRIWWRLDRALDEPSIRLSALVGGLDALRAGTTTVIDHHASPHFIDGSLDVIADALGELGVRAALCYEVTDRDGPERAAAGLAENVRFAKSRPALATAMVGAHASFTLSDKALEACAAAAAGAGVGVHIHVAEDEADQLDAIAVHGLRVVERLDRFGIVNEKALLAHCVHVNADEAAMIRDRGATVVHSARSNMNNAVGHSRLSGGATALGTDGIGGDMITESQAAYFRAREASLATPPSWPLARLAAGSRAAGRLLGEPLLGRIAPGAPADITVLEYPAPTPLSPGNLAGHWVFGCSPAQVRDVLVAGELVIADRIPTRIDMAGVVAEAERESRRLWDRLDQIPPHEFTPAGGACK
jgi:putative selenium metabolism protein SsnA